MPEQPHAYKAGELLKAGLEELGIEAPEERTGMFMTYLSELKRWNRAYSLTSVKSDEDIVIKHFLDSALYLAAIGEIAPKTDSLIVADVGSGAGFPGLPMKILRPDMTLRLIEPSRKKAAFLRYVIGKLSIPDAEVIEKRVEDVKDVNVDIAVTRALFKTPDFIRKASHIVRDGGLFVLSKGPSYKDEFKGREIAYIHKAIRLPFSGAERVFVMVRK